MEQSYNQHEAITRQSYGTRTAIIRQSYGNHTAIRGEPLLQQREQHRKDALLEGARQDVEPLPRTRGRSNAGGVVRA
eukprot:6917791-Prymnesium_polylepis.1